MSLRFTHICRLAKSELASKGAVSNLPLSKGHGRRFLLHSVGVLLKPRSILARSVAATGSSFSFVLWWKVARPFLQNG